MAPVADVLASFLLLRTFIVVSVVPDEEPAVSCWSWQRSVPTTTGLGLALLPLRCTIVVERGGVVVQGLFLRRTAALQEVERVYGSPDGLVVELRDGRRLGASVIGETSHASRWLGRASSADRTALTLTQMAQEYRDTASEGRLSRRDARSPRVVGCGDPQGWMITVTRRSWGS